MVQELEAVRTKLNEVTTENRALRSQAERSETALNATRHQLIRTGEQANEKTAESSELAGRLEHATREMEEAKAEYEKEVEKGKDTNLRVVAANKKIQELVTASVSRLFSRFTFSLTPP